MGVSADIGKGVLRSVEGFFGVDDPFFAFQCTDESVEVFWVFEVLDFAAKGECLLTEGMV